MTATPFAHVSTDLKRVATLGGNSVSLVAGETPLRDTFQMARYGYARVSTHSQRDDSQLDALRDVGWERIWTGTASGHAAARAATACPTCGREPTTRAEALQQREDLAVVWLHLDGDHLTETRHCLACQPHEHIVDVSCSCCGNGPLITGQPSELGDQLPAPAMGWLHARGWQLYPQPLCPKDRR